MLCCWEGNKRLGVGVFGGAAGKREWRVVYRDPQNECKRRQKTHSIKKYGFYAARSKAEDLRIELEKQYGW